MLTLSTMTATPSTSKTLSSSFGLSKASAYWKPEQPPPRTATRSACSLPSDWLASSSPIFSTALSERVIAAVGVSVTSRSVARGSHGTPGAAPFCENRRDDRERPDRSGLRHHCLPPHRAGRGKGDPPDQPLCLGRRRAG